MKSLPGNQRIRRGAAVVEAAACLPVVVMVFFATVEFGRGMMVGDLVSEAAREGARQAVLSGSTNTAVTQSIENFLQAASVQPAAVTVTVTITPAAGNANPGNELASAHMGDECQVEVSVPFSQVSYTSGHWLPGKHFTGTCTMRHE